MLKTQIIKYFVFFISILLLSSSYAQEKTDNTTPIYLDIREHSAKKASLFSTIIPGLGQAYNNQYWKIPVIYIGFGTLAYYYNNNKKEFDIYKDLYKRHIKKDPTVTGIYNFEVIKNAKEYYRKNRDLCVIGLAGLYIFNIIDASAYAHLFDYDISDDLSLKIEPIVGYTVLTNNTLGVKCTLKFN